MATTGALHEVGDGRDPRLVDGALALGLLLWVALDMVDRQVLPGQRPGDPLSWVLAVGMSLPYAVHRRAPLAAVAVVAGSILAYSLLHYPAYPGIGGFAVVFGVALHADRRRALVALGTILAVLLVSLWAQPDEVATFSSWLATALFTVVAYLAGENWRLRRARWARLEEHAALVERERDERARRAIAAERLRIARELHDAVAHAMSVIAVQAGMGHHVIDERPAEAKRALAAIESTTRTALVEMRRMLGVLREEGEPAGGLGPAQGLDDVPGLISAAADGGVDAELTVTGAPRHVPAGVDLSAYRIVQEALTNVIRHGGGRAHVALDYGVDRLRIEVTDDGATPGRDGARPAGGAVPDGADTGGHGLVGMRERAAVLDGHLTAGPLPDGGFRVRADLPLGGPR